MSMTRLKNSASKRLFRQAKIFIPGGVNSPVRAFKAVGANPLFIAKGRGSKIEDADGNSFIDYVMSWGALILGHSHPQVISVIKQACARGTSFGAPTQNETELARLICRAIPSIQMLRLVSSGTEATMSAIRLSRGYTGKDMVVKFSGNYHGSHDSVLVKAGSGATTLGHPDSAGVPKSLARQTLVLPYNDIDSAARIIKSRHKEIACVIVEPVSANMGLVLPKQGFLPGLRELTKRYGIVLIFDEVICGFRLAFGGAQTLHKIKPDLTCLGKIIGGGLPIGAYGGKAEIMRHLAPVGHVYQAGTLSGNPVSVSAGIATLRMLSKLDYRQLDRDCAILCNGLSEELNRQGVKFVLNRAGSMFTVFFTDRQKVFDYESALSSDTAKYARYFRSMLNQGIYLPCSQFEANFLSFAHTQQDIRETLKAHLRAISKLY